MIAITRIVPADLQELQLQTVTDADLSDVITALQANYSTIPAPLNTLCPTCKVEGAPTGFLSAALEGKTYKYPCTTCAGLMLIHTAEGALAAPVNPFERALTVTRILPADLNEILSAFPESGTLDAMITALQNNAPEGITRQYACAVCDNSTGWVTVNETKHLCQLCQGYQKTNYNYQVNEDGSFSEIIPNNPPPNPPLPVTPPVPQQQ